jgi:predicted O-methyltransferase YrrM
MHRTLSYAFRYLYALGGGAVLFTMGPFRARHRRMLNELARHFGYREPGAPRPLLPTVRLGDIVPPDTPVTLRALEQSDGNVTLHELYVIAAITRAVQPTSSFEIGTFDGRTTVNVAANSPRGAVTYTLDLPAQELAAARLPIESHERRFILKPASGALIESEGSGLRTEQLLGDSAAFDFARFEGRMDLVFVDGSHSYEYVLNDSARALSMIGDRGVVLWHDYGGFAGVTRALNELRAGGGSWERLRHVAGTSLALLEVGGALSRGGAPAPG